MSDSVDHPKHYNAHPSGVECIDIVEHLSFNLGNAIKYLWRRNDKGRRFEDTKKALWYLERELERLHHVIDVPEAPPAAFRTALLVANADRHQILSSVLNGLAGTRGHLGPYPMIDAVEFMVAAVRRELSLMERES